MKRNALLASVVAAALVVSGAGWALKDRDDGGPKEPEVVLAEKRVPIDPPKFVDAGGGLFLAPAGVAPSIELVVPESVPTTIEHYPDRDVTRFLNPPETYQIQWYRTRGAKPVPRDVAQAALAAFTTDTPATQSFRSRFEDLSEPIKVYVARYQDENLNCRDFLTPPGVTRDPKARCVIVAVAVTAGPQDRPIYGANNLLLSQTDSGWELDPGAVCLADFGPRSCDANAEGPKP